MLTGSDLSGYAQFFQQTGFLGVAIVIGFIAWKLFQRLMDLQEKRILEARETVTAMNATATAIEQLSDLIKAGTAGRGQ